MILARDLIKPQTKKRRLTSGKYADQAIGPLFQSICLENADLILIEVWKSPVMLKSISRLISNRTFSKSSVKIFSRTEDKQKRLNEVAASTTTKFSLTIVA